MSPHVMWRHIVYCFCGFVVLWVTLATKSTKFGSRYLGEGSSERDEILQVAKGGLIYPTTQTGDIWPRGSSGEPNIEGCKKFVTLFFQGGFTDHDEIWKDGWL